MGGEELKWRQLAHHHILRQQGPHFSPHSKAKAIYKAQISGKLVTSVISDVATSSVHSEKTRPKKLIMIIRITPKKRRFSRGPEINFRHETIARIVMIDFKFDALYC